MTDPIVPVVVSILNCRSSYEFTDHCVKNKFKSVQLSNAYKCIYDILFDFIEDLVSVYKFKFGDEIIDRISVLTNIGMALQCIVLIINSHIDYDLTIEIISVKIFHEGKWKSHLCLDYDKMTIERLVASLRE
jgi:hypothetical protein